MVNCVKCGEPIEDGVKFCASCGTPITDGATPKAAKPAPAEQNKTAAKCANCGKPLDKGVKFCASCGTPIAGGAAPAPALREADPVDAERNRGMAVVCYLVFFIPLVIGEQKKSEYVKFHANQGTVLFLFGVAGWIVMSLLFGLITAASFRSRSLGMLSFMTFLSFLFGVFFLVLEIMGIVNSLKCKTSRLPLIGRIEIIK